MSAWRYVTSRPFRYHADVLRGRTFKNEWLTIDPSGWLEIAEGYAWDGCSPAWRIPGTGWWLGTPDGPLMADGRPAAYYASLVHDVFCQFHDDVPLTKQQVSNIFERMLRERAFSPFLASIYRRAVDLFGPASFGTAYAKV